MSENSCEQIRETVEAVYRADSRRVLATLIRLLGDFDLAEEALQDALAAAVEQWTSDGVPTNPRAWLISTGRFKAIDAMRRRARFDASLIEMADQLESSVADSYGQEIEDDRLRLIFTCCHPSLPPDARLALTLRESRRASRTSPEGELVLLDDQDRSRWNQDQIEEGTALVKRALSSRPSGPYALQAAIAAVHAEAHSAALTDWAQIVRLYDVLVHADPSPVIELNRAVAVAMRDGPVAGLVLIEALLERGDLVNYYLAHSARADLYRRLGNSAEARASYDRALNLTRQEPARRFLQQRINELKSRFADS